MFKSFAFATLKAVLRLRWLGVKTPIVEVIENSENRINAIANYDAGGPVQLIRHNEHDVHAQYIDQTIHLN